MKLGTQIAHVSNGNRLLFLPEKLKIREEGYIYFMEHSRYQKSFQLQFKMFVISSVIEVSVVQTVGVDLQLCECDS